MKKTVLLIFLIAFKVYAQPAEEKQKQISRLGQLMQESGSSMTCERKKKEKDGVEKTVLQFFPFEHRLISTITVYKKRTSWSAQTEIEALRLGKAGSEGNERTHLKIASIQKGGGQVAGMHLQMDLQEESFQLFWQTRGQKPKFYAYEKGNLNHPFICHLDEQRVR